MIKRKWHWTLVGLLIVLVFLFPIYWMVITSLKTSAEIFGSPALFPKEINFNAYVKLFTQNQIDVLNYFKNSMIISTGTMLGAVMLGAPAAYAIARKKMKGVTLFLLFILVTQMFPSNMLALPLYTMFSNMGLLNSYMGVIIADLTLTLPFVILILRTYFLTIPSELEDAAAIDGCTRWGAFLRIILPLARPGLLTCASFSFLLSWGEFLYALTMLKDNEMWTITLGMRQFVGQFGTNWTELMALSSISALPIILIFIATQRYIVSGITAGATK